MKNEMLTKEKEEMYQSLDKHYDAKSAFECFVKVTPEQMETL
jgi:hypothetical protein